MASIIAKLVDAGMLLGALGRHQHGYYTLLRWGVCGASDFGTLQAAELGKSGWTCPLAIVALFFNAVIPIRLKRNTRRLIDLAVAGLLVISIAAVDRQAPPP
jgi:hypothetical protein